PSPELSRRAGSEAAIDLCQLAGAETGVACAGVGVDRTRAIALLAADIAERTQELAAPAAMRRIARERLERSGGFVVATRPHEQLAAGQLRLGTQRRRW